MIDSWQSAKGSAQPDKCGCGCESKKLGSSVNKTIFAKEHLLKMQRPDKGLQGSFPAICFGSSAANSLAQAKVRGRHLSLI